MKHTLEGVLPFSVDRANPQTLTDQLVNGIIQAIRSGRYAPGERLPSIKVLAASLETSEMVVRNAVRRLVEMGEVVTRPRTGIRVRDSGAKSWTAHVLFVEMSDSFYFTARLRAVRERLDDAGVRLTSVLLDEREYRQGLPRIRAVLDCAAVDLVVLSGDVAGVASEVVRRNVPFVSVMEMTGSSQALGVLKLDHRAALEEMAGHCRRCGVGSTAAIFPWLSDARSVEDVFAEAGLSCRVVYGRDDTPCGGAERVERGGLSAMRTLLQRRDLLPDLVYFNDDYAARGGLTAILEAGVRVPEELQVVTWVNRDHSPVFIKELTRVEVAPREHAQAISELALTVLKTRKKLTSPCVVRPRFIVGQTTRPPA